MKRILDIIYKSNYYNLHSIIKHLICLNHCALEISYWIFYWISAVSNNGYLTSRRVNIVFKGPKTCLIISTGNRTEKRKIKHNFKIKLKKSLNGRKTELQSWTRCVFSFFGRQSQLSAKHIQCLVCRLCPLVLFYIIIVIIDTKYERTYGFLVVNMFIWNSGRCRRTVILSWTRSAKETTARPG